jgi:hypothetical protein
MAKKKREKKDKVRGRYSIGEWYGIPIESLSAEKVRDFAARELECNGLTSTPCPFQTAPPRDCNKKGGVCSLRLYEQTGEHPVVRKGPLVTTCPQRFVQNEEIFRWVSEVILQHGDPIVLGEIGFLDRLRPDEETTDLDEESQDFIGRIDKVLVHPTKTPIEWCALELQAVYFSGKAMSAEFKMLAAEVLDAVPFPAEQRRPDWRSSGPKRLLPQLQTKVPTISTWGKKVAVVIDEAFYESLVGLKREKYLTNAEIIWFIVRYEPSHSGWRLVRKEFVPTRLQESVKALTGGTPLPKEKFEAQLQRKLAKKYPTHALAKVF